MKRNPTAETSLAACRIQSPQDESIENPHTVPLKPFRRNEIRRTLNRIVGQLSGSRPRGFIHAQTAAGYDVGVQQLEVRSGRGVYHVRVERGALCRLREILEVEGLSSPRAMVTDAVVGPLHGRAAAAALGIEMLELPGGEPNKTWTEVEALCRRWLETGLTRGESVLALGGGVVTDTAGFAAAVYLRGIDWIAAPTTLLGMVDAAVGGKTGVNLPQGKNLVGSFWPPRLVVADPDLLSTLPARELRAGLAEVIKTAWIGDHDLLGLLKTSRGWSFGALDPEGWERVVTRAAAVKIGIVVADERESGRRKALNLGHTMGHALEAATAYRRFLHGEAVAWGLRTAGVLARRRGLMSAEAEHRLGSAVDALGSLPPVADLDPALVCSLIAADKKRDSDGVCWVLPTDDGVVLDQRIETAEAVEVFRELQGGR
jgi:3-dehydroquinate synthetase